MEYCLLEFRLLDIRFCSKFIDCIGVHRRIVRCYNVRSLKEHKSMEIDELVIYDCPVCEGAALLEEEGNSYYVTCMECGCHSVNVNFKSEDQRLDAAKRTVDLWNKGKVIKMEPGE